MRFSSRWNWVPKILVNQPLYISPLFAIQHARRDVVAHGVGHHIADGAGLPHALPDHRGRYVHPRHLDDPAAGRVPRPWGPRAREHDHIRERWERVDLGPGGERSGRIRPTPLAVRVP